MFQLNPQMAMEAMFWLGLVTSCIGMWKFLSWVAHIAHSPFTRADPANDVMQDVQHQLSELQHQNGQLQKEIDMLRNKMRVQTGMGEGPPLVVYVTNSGDHYHIHSECTSIKGRDRKEFQLCKLCLKKEGKKTH